MKRLVISVVVFVCIFAAVLCVVHYVIIPNKEYETAVTLMDTGRFNDAYSIFVSLDEFKDSKEKADSIFIKAKTESLSKASIGSYVTFGNYLQNHSGVGIEPIEWLVLAKEKNRLFVISRYALHYHHYNEDLGNGNLAWRECELRTWLNNDFLNKAFNSEEQSLISEVELSDCLSFDRVFLLNESEANKYFKSDKDRQCEPTEHARILGARTGFSDYCWWWLRSNGIYLSRASYVNPDGAIDNYPRYIVSEGEGVRPALWINLNP